MNALIINWVIAALGLAIAIVGVYFIFSAIKRLAGSLKNSMIFLAISMTLLIIFSFAMGYALSNCQEVNHSKNIWMPITFTIGTSLFTFGSKKLLNTLVTISNK